MKRITLALLLSFILIVPLAEALSVTPSSTQLNPQEQYPQTFEFFVGNPDGTMATIDVTVEGNLKDYITIDSYDETIPASGQSKVRFTVNLPENTEPGNYKSEIKIIPKETIGSGGVGFKVAVAHVVWFDIPFEGKHLRTNLILNRHPNNMIDVVAQAINDGTEDVEGAEIAATFYSPNGNVIKSFDGIKDVEVGMGATINSLITIDEPMEGEYKAVMSIVYDGETVSEEKTAVLMQAAEETSSGETTTTGVAEIVGSDNTVLYALIIVVVVLLGYIFLKRK